MRIKWLGDMREIPGCGILKKGDEREIRDDVAKRLIKNKQGKEIKIAAKPAKEV